MVLGAGSAEWKLSSSPADIVKRDGKLIGDPCRHALELSTPPASTCVA